jgi:cysteine desulfuration protein SufE
MTIQEIQEEIIEEFSFFEDWMEKYEHIIELGKGLPLINPELKSDDRLIKGCQSKVWLDSKVVDEKVVYTADSDAIITKGLIALMVRVLTNQKPEEIMNADLYFIDAINLKEHLSPTRSNGLLSMVKQMKMDALVYSQKTQ